MSSALLPKYKIYTNTKSNCSLLNQLTESSRQYNFPAKLFLWGTFSLVLAGFHFENQERGNREDSKGLG